MKQIKRIAVIDLWTDANRGDNALQVGLLKMLRDTYPGANISGIFRFGTNEINHALPEIEYTIEHLDNYHGGLRRTSYAGARATRSTLYRKFHSLISFLELFLIIVLYKCHLNFLISRRKNVIMKLLEEADLVIWKGKNFREYSGLLGIQRQLTLNITGIITRLFSKNIICVNASFWRICNPVQKWIVRTAFRTCRKVTVRDKQSITNFEAILDKKPEYCPDLSFYDIYDRLKLFDHKNVTKKYDLALTVTSWGSLAEKNQYLHTLAVMINGVISANPEAKIAIVPQVVRLAEDTSIEIQQLTDRIGPQYFDFLPRVLDINQLLMIYAQTEKLIGTRMHSCVFAACVGTPFLAIAYDEGPKWQILEDIAPKEVIINYSKLHEIDIYNVLDNIRLLDFDLEELAMKAKNNVSL